jgi:hypothetical protein
MEDVLLAKQPLDDMLVMDEKEIKAYQRLLSVGLRENAC